MNEILTGTYELVRHPNGAYEFLRHDGLPIGPLERETLIDAVRYSCREQGNASLNMKADAIAKKAKWLFPDENSDLHGRKTGVYFVQDDAYPGLVKIGYTSGSVLSRVNGLRHQQGCIEPSIVAFAMTDHYKILEAGLHAKFQSQRVTGEWFRFQPVHEYISSIGGA